MITFPRPPVADAGGPRGSNSYRPCTDDTSAGIDGHHGAIMPKSHPNAVRLVSVNIAGIGFISEERSKMRYKLEKLKNLVIDYDVDLLMLSETNKDWRVVPSEHSLWAGVRYWKSSCKVQAAWNTFQHPQIQHQSQRGGTAMIAFSDLSYRLCQKSVDSRQLGRWSIMTFQGKRDCKTTAISLYVPTLGTCPGSVFSQHLRYTAEHRHLLETECPRELFGKDLEELILHYKSEGHNIIVAGDFNAEAVDMRRWMQELGLIDLIQRQHSPCPRTQKRSKNSPIDFIFGSPGLQIRACGYLPFNRLVSDHRALWIDVEQTSFLGYKPPPLLAPAARRLKLEDPEVVSKYLSTLHSILLAKDVFNLASMLDSITTTPLPEWVIEIHEKLDRILYGSYGNSRKEI